MKTTKIMILFIAFIGAFLLSACSNKEVYNTVQKNRKQDCQKLPPSVYEECIKQHSESFDEYERKRRQVLNKDRS